MRKILQTLFKAHAVRKCRRLQRNLIQLSKKRKTFGLVGCDLRLRQQAAAKQERRYRLRARLIKT